LSNLNPDNLAELSETGQRIRAGIMEGSFPADMEQAIREAVSKIEQESNSQSFAIRSSATAEDLPDASFAGQQETILNVSGVDNILASIKEVFASLYNDRAISYRAHQGFEHMSVYLSVGVQKMVRSDLAQAGVMFTMDTESGFDQVVFITSAYGLGETVVQGAVNPDEFYVHKEALKADRPAILRRNLGAKAVKMVYSDGEELVTTERVSREMRLTFSLTDD